jgi:transposase
MPQEGLYRALGVSNIQHFQIYNSYQQSGWLHFPLKLKREYVRCSHCKGDNVIIKRWSLRQLTVPPVGNKPAMLMVDVPRVYCKGCQCEQQAHLPFAEPKKQHTRQFAKYIIQLRKHMTLRDLAAHTGVSDYTIREIEKRYLQRHFEKPRLRQVTRLGIDEICIGKGHRYLTIVMDLTRGNVLFVGEGKGHEGLKPFFRSLKASRAKIEAVVIDLSPAFQSAVKQDLPEALVVCDHFHITKLFNEQLSVLRRELYHEATTKLEQDVLKGTRWLILMNQEHLSQEPGHKKVKHQTEYQRLEEALKLNKSLATAYYLKEELREFWQQADTKHAERFLDDWCQRATASGIRVMLKFAKTLQTHRQGLLNWYQCPISTGPLEGTNNKIKTLQRQAYGFRDQHYFKLKIYALHLSRYKLIG